MAWDVAIDKDTGDWLFGANTDLQAVQGDQVVQQRLMTRIRVPRGWLLDPTQGTLGSLLRIQALRIPRPRLLNELPLMIREALAPMTDIRVNEVWVEETGSHAVTAHVKYVTIDPTLPVRLDEQIEETLAFTVGV